MVALSANGKPQALGTYVHQSHLGETCGKVVAAVAIEGEVATSVANDIAAHVAAMAPEYATVADIPEAVLAKEKAGFIERAQKDGKQGKVSQ
jgi:translation elongation factor EF-Ts